MKSMPASSAMTASRLLSGQLPDQRSGTSVTARPDEQFGPNRPICSLLLLYIDRRAASEPSRGEVCGACTVSPRLTDIMLFIPRHCERSEATQRNIRTLDCFVAPLVAM